MLILVVIQDVFHSAVNFCTSKVDNSEFKKASLQNEEAFYIAINPISVDKKIKLRYHI